eukprot:151762_1
MMIPHFRVHYFYFSLAIFIRVVHCNTIIKSETLTASNSDISGASVLSNIQEVQQNHNNEWNVSIYSEDTWQFHLLLDNTWGFDPNLQSTTHITIDSSTPEAIEDLLFGFTVHNNQYFAVRIPMDNDGQQNEIYPKCDTWDTPTQPFHIGDIESVPNTSRVCDISGGNCAHWRPMQPKNAQWPKIFEFNTFPITFTLQNDPIGDTFKMYFNTASYTTSFIQKCGFVSLPTESGLKVYIAGGNPGDEFVISSIAVEYTLSTTSPTETPTQDPIASPTQHTTDKPTQSPVMSTHEPTSSPTAVPSNAPTNHPSMNPSITPSQMPIIYPTHKPTQSPDPTFNPTSAPTIDPTSHPTVDPTDDPTIDPTTDPTLDPTTSFPTVIPSMAPTHHPTLNPTKDPTSVPSINPSIAPSEIPTHHSTTTPTPDPTGYPSPYPTSKPTRFPIVTPSMNPSVAPSETPTITPTVNPTIDPTINPTVNPSVTPSEAPITNPTMDPTFDTTVNPTTNPSPQPSIIPTSHPTVAPTTNPSSRPSIAPTTYPTFGPVSKATNSTEHTTLSPSSSTVFFTSMKRSTMQSASAMESGLRSLQFKDLIIPTIIGVVMGLCALLCVIAATMRQYKLKKARQPATSTVTIRGRTLSQEEAIAFRGHHYTHVSTASVDIQCGNDATTKSSHHYQPMKRIRVDDQSTVSSMNESIMLPNKDDNENETHIPLTTLGFEAGSVLEHYVNQDSTFASLRNNMNKSRDIIAHNMHSYQMTSLYDDISFSDESSTDDTMIPRPNMHNYDSMTWINEEKSDVLLDETQCTTRGGDYHATNSDFNKLHDAVNNVTTYSDFEKIETMMEKRAMQCSDWDVKGVIVDRLDANMKLTECSESES